MALVECPVCHKRMSSKSLRCPNCDLAVNGDNESAIRIQQIKKAAQLQTHSFIALTLFIVGVVIWFWGGEVAEGKQALAGSVCFVFGFVGYLITRLRIVLNKRKN